MNENFHNLKEQNQKYKETISQLAQERQTERAEKEDIEKMLKEVLYRREL